MCGSGLGRWDESSIILVICSRSIDMHWLQQVFMMWKRYGILVQISYYIAEGSGWQSRVHCHTMACVWGLSTWCWRCSQWVSLDQKHCLYYRLQTWEVLPHWVKGVCRTWLYVEVAKCWLFFCIIFWPLCPIVVYSLIHHFFPFLLIWQVFHKSGCRCQFVLMKKRLYMRGPAG